MLSRSAAFNARYSTYRNMLYGFDGRYIDALKTLYAWAGVPLFSVGVVYSFKGQIKILAVSSYFVSVLIVPAAVIPVAILLSVFIGVPSSLQMAW